MFEQDDKSASGVLRMLLVGAFIICLPLALITTNIRVALSEQAVYDYSVKEYDASEVARIPESELLRANGQIRDYLVNDHSGPLSIRVANDEGREITLFNARETAHMADVRELVQGVLLLQVLAVAAVLSLALLISIIWAPRALAAALLYSSLATGVLLGGAGLLAASGFDAAWSRFHEISFANNLWQLDPDTDHLIQMFPEAFWQEITVLIGVATIVELLAAAALASFYLLLTREKQPQEPAERPRPTLPGRSGHARLAPPDPRHYTR